jgi:predicted Zn-dependent peptidase
MLICHRNAKIGKICRIFANGIVFMMKYSCKQIFCILIGLLSAIGTSAQDLPVLPADPAIKAGSLPNGLNYYIVSNTNMKGLADFALVQKTGMENIPDTAASRSISLARESLASLPRCRFSSVQEFFTSHGADFNQDGFVKVSDNSTIFRFNDVQLSSAEVLDSTILVMMDMVDRVSTTDDRFLKKWYSPSDQAIIIAGDIDAASTIEKLRLMSMMTPAVSTSMRLDYVWESRDSAKYLRRGDTLNRYSSVTFSWRSARTPREYMNTIQPVIYEMFLAELSMIAEEGIKESLDKKGIPYGDVYCRHVTSVQSSGDEAFNISLAVKDSDLSEAVRTVSEVVSGIDAGNTKVLDFVKAKKICIEHVNSMSHRPAVLNSDYVNKCITAFLYNGSLSSLGAKVEYLVGRQLADTTELRLFNGIASALLDPEKNMEVVYDSAMTPDSLRNIFISSWTEKDTTLVQRPEYSVSDIPVYVHEGTKIKLKSEKTDFMSQGIQWVFSNGFKVVYKKMDTQGKLYYNLAVNGGYGSVDNLEKGEGGYFSDYFFLSRINGIPAKDFVDILSLEGMEMDAYVGLTNTMISGSLPQVKIDLLMNSLLAVTNSWEKDEEAVERYASGESIRNHMRKGTDQERIARINEIMCPDYRFASHKSLDTLSSDLSGKVEKMLDMQSSSMNDGVLVLLGDMDEVILKKKLLSYVGGFRTTERAFRRPLVRYQPSAGWSTYTADGKDNRIDIALSVPMTLTIDNFMTAEIASMVLKKKLAEAIVNTGMHLEVSHECRVYPHERLNVHILLTEVPADGFSSEVTPTGAIEALLIIRNTLDDISSAEVTKTEVDNFKTRLKCRMAIEMNTPFYWLNVISRRHLAGKDFTSRHEARIDAVTVEAVTEMISRLNDGARVEYIEIRK